MKNTFKISALVLAMTFFANYTNAQQQGRGRQMISFSTLDANKDGKVTESEFNTARENQMEKTNGRGMRIQNISFADIDIDSNNEVSQEEFSKFSPNRQGRGQGRNQGRRNGRGNGQGNGQGRQNAMAQNQPSFESYDIDKDGFVSEDEFIKARQERAKSQAEKGGQLRGLADAPTFSSVDLNKNGKISKYEFDFTKLNREGNMHRGQVKK